MTLINNECNVCPEGTIKCTHYNNQAVAYIVRKNGLWTVLRYRNGVEAEGHVCAPKPNEVYDSLVEYILR